MAATQLLLDLENAPGALAQLMDVLNDAGVPIAGLCTLWARRAAFDRTPQGPAARTEAAAQLAEAGISTLCACATAEGTRPVVVMLSAADAGKARAALRRTEEQDGVGERQGRRLRLTLREECEAGMGVGGPTV